MRVILLEKMRNLGNVGDEVRVKSGFGRNFLIPHGKAVLSNENNRAVFELRSANLDAAVAKNLMEIEKRKEKLVAIGSIKIIANASAEGKLFGSIGAADIANQLNNEGADVRNKEVQLPTGALRYTGEYTVDVQLYTNIIVTVKISIISYES
ncbi:MAG: 50S ribosomal protein L9 [Piscirickettsiaceae bacterium]|nr:50S ribosomal protein L9 [Piscirickettsiaceae bacterium]